MKITKKGVQERLDFFRTLYENAKHSYADKLEAFDRNMKQYKGSDEIDGGERAIAVRNITYEIIESQISSDIPQPKADPEYYSEERGRLAEAIEALCRSLRDKLPFEELNDLDERYTYIYGGSIWFAEWDNTESFGGIHGGVKVHCLSPRNFIPEPGVYNIEDMEYCFLSFTATRAEISRKYGIHGEALLRLDSDMGNIDSSDDGDTATVTVTFYKNEEGEVSQFIFSGDVTLLDIEGYYKRKLTLCRSCGLTADECRCERPRTYSVNVDTERVGTDKVIGDVPYYTPRRFPIVVRKNTSAETCLLGQSDCEYIRPEQQAINKVESRILQKLLRSGITPIVPEDATISINNSVFGQIIKMKPGETVSQYGTVDTTPDISQDIAEAERLYEHSKRILGISDAFQGISESSNESGYARQLRISQSSGRLESKKKMKHTAYAALDRIIFEHYLAFADETRCLDYKDAFGRVRSISFNKHDFLVYDPEERCFRYDDTYLFSVDLNGGSEYQRETLWQRNLENLNAGTLGDPHSPITLLRYWQCQERAHYPYARDNVEYFTELIAKGREYDEKIQGSV
ncbi:MAG: hypothetical protein IKD45_01020 [Clostridia bacterium]|nr:hypothetical protein [Clostridia bacterium]